MDVKYREYRSDDSEEVCGLLNPIFSQAQFSHERWREVTASDFTAPVAVLDGRIVGAIPLKRRIYRVAPGCEVVAWVLFRVGVSSELRDRGVGSGMQRAIKEFLHDRGDILLVNTCGHHTKQYRFYRRNGLYDVACPQHFSVPPLDGSNTEAPHAFRNVSQEEFFANRARWVDLFHSCHAGLGGYPVRTEAYPFDHLSLLHKRPSSPRTACISIGPPDRPVGYAFFPDGGAAINVQELAVRDASPTVAAGLLEALRSLGRPVSLPASRGTMLWRILNERSISSSVQVERTRPVIVHILNIESTADRVWNCVSRLEDVTVRARTHAREGIIHRGPDSSRDITLDLHEQTLSRLLMRRIDVAQAVAEERIAVTGADQADIDALAAALPPCPWVYHGIDGL